MKWFAPLMRPTLTRRVLLTLLATAALAWVVLLAYYFVRETHPQTTDATLRLRARGMAEALAKIDDADRAQAAASFLADLLNGSLKRPSLAAPVVVVLLDGKGQALFRHPAGGGTVLAGELDRIDDLRLDGADYRALRTPAGPWQLVVAEPRSDGSGLLGKLGSDLALSVLISFPFVLLPTWFAVSRGLQPLRQLSQTIAAKGPDDLAPLGLPARYEELRPVIQALDRLLAQLRGKISREHAFVEDAAHELRTPIAVMAFQAHVLARADSDAERQLAAQQMDQVIQRASRLIEQLLTLARIDAAAPARTASVDVAQLLRQTLAEATPQALAREVDLSLEAPDSLTQWLDEAALQSVVQNLLGNALRYVQHGGQVVVALAPTATGMSLSVSDDGPGIAPQDRALVFERFYRVAGTQAAGSGLGLAIVAQAVARMRGTLSLSTGLHGRGCCFRVDLPRQDI